MFNSKFMRALPLVVLAVAMAFATPLGTVRAAASDGNITLSSPMLQGTEPITVYGADTALISTLDPQRGEDQVSITPLENLFLGLTDVDPKTSKIRPEVATKWEKNAAGDVWTFTLRTDIPWVRWDPKTQKATKVRNVVAGDFEYGIKRSCDPRLGAYYTSVSAAMIKGCDVVAQEKTDAVKDADFDQIGVKALSDSQLEITTQGPLPFFESTTPMWMLRAVPKEVIAQFGDQWTEPGNIVTDGPFLLDQWDKNVNRVFVKNPLYPKDVENSYGGNVERISTIIVKDAGTIYSLFQNNEVDTSGVPRSEESKILADANLKKQLIRHPDLSTFYFGFGYDKPPFDNVHARRAFSAAVDRKTFVDSVIGNTHGLPIAHFMPPGIFGAVGINEVGIGKPDNLGFDADFAKKEMTAAGYANCENFPNITILTYAGATNWAEYLQNQVKTNLGCDVSKISIEEAEFSVLLKSIKPDVPTPQRPNMWTLGWGPDYPDAQNWIHDVLSCNAENDFKRPCGDIDKKIDAAAKELDSKKRAQDYRELETEFFGAEGEFTIIPLYTRVVVSMIKPWYKGPFETDALFGGNHWDTRVIDQAAQLSARGGANKPQVTPTPVPTAAATAAAS